MANEIQVNVSLHIVNGSFRDSFLPGTSNVTQNATSGQSRKGGSVQIIGTSEEVVALGDIASNGYLCLQNLDGTNYVEFGPESGGAMVAFGKLKAGEVAILRVKPAVVIRAQANTAAVLLDVRMYND